MIQQTKLAFIAASPGLGACAYCEAGAASVLDHWRPRSQYPHLCFDVLNLIPTCRDCNEGSKRAKFPLDFGGSPLLLDPFQDDPLDHIELDLTNGAYAAVTPRGHTTIRTFKLDRTSLRTARLDAVRHAQRRLLDYYHARQGNHIADANLIEGELARMQHESVLAYLTRASRTRSPPKGFHPDVAFALRTYPQVQRF